MDEEILSPVPPHTVEANASPARTVPATPEVAAATEGGSPADSKSAPNAFGAAATSGEASTAVAREDAADTAWADEKYKDAADTAWADGKYKGCGRQSSIRARVFRARLDNADRCPPSRYSIVRSLKVETCRCRQPRSSVASAN